MALIGLDAAFRAAVDNINERCKAEGIEPLGHDEAIVIRNALETQLRDCGARLSMYPKTSLGLTQDDAKASAIYQADKKARDQAFAALRAFNAWFVRAFPRR